MFDFDCGIMKFKGVDIFRAIVIFVIFILGSIVFFFLWGFNIVYIVG